MNTMSAGNTTYLAVPNEIMHRLKSYLMRHNAKLSLFKQTKVLYDYICTIRVLYSEEEAKNIEQKVAESYISTIRYRIPEQDGSLVLSEIPRIELDVRYPDNNTMLFRGVYIGNIAADEWRTARGGAAAVKAARYAFLLMRKIIGFEDWRTYYDDRD